MNNQTHIPIVLATDENYAPFASIMMKSVLMHTNSFLEFYILDGGITQKTKTLIKKDLKKFSNKKIEYIDMQKYGLERFPNLKHYSLNTFSRYFIPKLFPHLTKIIYLDVDIIVKKDITELFHQDIETYSLAAVLEDFYPGNYTTLKTKIWPSYQGKDQYFNAGVLLLNIPKLINDNFTEKATQLTEKLYHKLSAADQDILNILYDGKFKALDYSFNYMPDHIGYLRKKHPNIHNIDPLIMHYTAAKPWKSVSRASKDFWQVASQSLFKVRIENQYLTKHVFKYFLFGKIPLFFWRKK